MMDDVIADHAAVDATPFMKPEWGPDGQIEVVLADGKAVASWTVHEGFPNSIHCERHSSPLRQVSLAGYRSSPVSYGRCDAKSSLTD